jgi:general secretion pathway protein G
MLKKSNLKKAFTLIELLVVMIVIALLALIVVPQFASRSTQARESNLRGNLKSIRTAISTWQADTGAFPADLTKMTAASAPTGVTGWNGPYLTAPLVQDPTVASASGVNANWSYTASSGALASANASYSSW